MSGAGRHAITREPHRVEGNTGRYIRVKLLRAQNNPDAAACEAACLGEHGNEEEALEAAAGDVLKGAERIVIMKVVASVTRSVKVER